MGLPQCIKAIFLILIFTRANIFCKEHTSVCEYKAVPKHDAWIAKCTGKDITGIPNGIFLNITELHIENANIGILNMDDLQSFTELNILKVEESELYGIKNTAQKGTSLLKMISFRRNKLLTLPKNFFSNLQNLKSIDLSENLIDFIDGMFDGLENLEKLSLNGNRISALSPNAFNDLVLLHHLELNENKISKIDAGTFANNRKIMFLSLASNPLSDVHNIFPNDMTLQYLNMTDCHLKSLPRDLPPSLKYIQLSGNKIQQILKQDTQSYINLNALVLGGNGLTSVENGAFAAMTSLTDIFLFENSLKEIPGPFPASIRSIHLDNNNITDFQEDMFQHGTKMSILSLRNNDLQSLPPQAFQNILSIQELHLEGNQFKFLPDAMFGSLKALQYLNLNRMDMHIIFENCFQGLRDLKKLEMSFVNVHTIIGNIFKPLVSLQELQLQQSPTLAWSFLTHLAADKMKIGTLNELNLMDNDLETLTQDLSQYLPNINKLALSGNKLLCNSDLLWLKDWQALEPEKFFMFDQVRCHLPQHLHGQSIADISALDFMSNTTGIPESSSSTTTNADFTEPDYGGEVTQHYYFDEVTEDQYPDHEYFDTYVDYGDDYNDYSFSTVIIPQASDWFSSSTMTSSTPSMTSSISSMTSSTPSTTDPSSLTTSMASKPVNQPPVKQPVTPNKSSGLKAVGIAIAMSFGVIFIMLAIAFIIYKLWRRKLVTSQHKHNHCESQDYVFVASHEPKPETKVPRKLSRTERGSTTSRASEDITNEMDLDMKVYTLDIDA